MAKTPKAELPPGYAVETLKHEDGGFLVFAPGKVVVAVRPTRDKAVAAARKHFEAKQ